MIMDQCPMSSMPPMNPFRLHLFFFHMNDRPGLGIKVDLLHLFLRGNDFYLPDQSVVLLLQLGFDDRT